MLWHVLWMARTCRLTPDAYCKRCGAHHFLKPAHRRSRTSAWQVCCRVMPYISVQEHSKLKWKIILDAEHITWKVVTTQISKSSCALSNTACCRRCGAHHFQTMRQRELQFYKYVAVGFLISQYKNILNSNGTSSLTHNSLHAKSLEDRYQLVIVFLRF